MAIEIEILGHNLVVSESVHDAVTKKAAKLERFINDVEAIKVDLSYVKTARDTNDRMVAQITAYIKKAILRTEERSDDLMAAFDTAIEKMQRQMERYKGRHYHNRGDGRTAAEVALPLPEESGEYGTPTIAKRKQIKMLPMKEADALEQMRMLGHDNFFIFFDVESNATSVIYRRRDGTYGVIKAL